MIGRFRRKKVLLEDLEVIRNHNSLLMHQVSDLERTVRYWQQEWARERNRWYVLDMSLNEAKRYIRFLEGQIALDIGAAREGIDKARQEVRQREPAIIEY